MATSRMMEILIISHLMIWGQWQPIFVMVNYSCLRVSILDSVLLDQVWQLSGMVPNQYVNVSICILHYCFSYSNYYQITLLCYTIMYYMFDNYLVPDPCLSSPCDDNAVCIRANVTSDAFSCTCLMGFTGNGHLCTGMFEFLLVYCLSITENEALYYDSC